MFRAEWYVILDTWYKIVQAVARNSRGRIFITFVNLCALLNGGHTVVASQDPINVLYQWYSHKMLYQVRGNPVYFFLFFFF